MAESGTPANGGNGSSKPDGHPEQNSAAMVALIPVRGGVLPLGAEETVAEAGGRAMIVGSETAIAAEALGGLLQQSWLMELGPFGPGRWAQRCRSALLVGPSEGGHVILPGSPDGRDLGPRLAAELDRDYLAGVTRLSGDSAERPRYGGRVSDVLTINKPIVATLQAGVRGIGTEDHHNAETVPTVIPVPPDLPTGNGGNSNGGTETGGERASVDPILLAELPADPSTMDLAEADRIVGGGAGLGSAEAVDRMADLAIALGASPGGTRVITDWGWLPVERQIGTTGVTVDPSLYLAIGISGAVQHTAGLGNPDHVISVNTDPHCPMMGLADLAIVTDAPAFLDALLGLLDRPSDEAESRPAATGGAGS